MIAWLSHLDSHDRALFTRVRLAPTCPRERRTFWLIITHGGGARASVGACLLSPLHPAVTLLIAWKVLLLLGASHAVVQLIKRTVGRPRPTESLSTQALVIVPDHFSFPSGHACAAMAVAVGFATAFPMLTVPLLVLALLVGISRVMLGAHYPGDVVAGQVIALAAAYPLLR